MTILIVSPAYAPFTGVGANRMMSFSRYLVSKGHSVIVLRNAPECWPADSLKSVPPDGVVIRDVYVTSKFNACAASYYNAIQEAYREFAIDCAVYSCGPYYTIVAAARFKKETQHPFIIDFRDLWLKAEIFSRSAFIRASITLFRQRNRLKERRSIEAADHIVTVAPLDNAALKAEYPQCADKMSVIYNGYDLDRSNGGSDEKELDTIDRILARIDGYHTVGVFGKFGYYDYDYMVEFLNAIKELNETGHRLRIVHIGDLDARSQKAMSDVSFPDDLYIGTGYLDYKTGIEVLKRLSMNCLLVHYKRGLGTKVFDYIFVDRPVVYFAPPDSSIAAVLNTCRHSYCCRNAKDAVKAVEEILNNGFRSLGCPDSEKYSRSAQNERYERLLEQVVEQTDPGSLP